MAYKSLSIILIFFLTSCSWDRVYLGSVIADGGTTYYGLRIQTAYEANPFLSGDREQVLMRYMFINAAFFMLLSHCNWRPFWIIGTVVHCLAVGWNASQIYQYERRY